MQAEIQICNKFSKTHIALAFLLFVYNIESNGQANEGEVCRVVNNDFANLPFGKKLSSNEFSKSIDGFLTLEKKKINNIHTGEVDTLFSYYYINSVLVFYKGSIFNGFRSALIQDSGIKLMYGIEIGNIKSVVFDKLGISGSVIANVILITDEEDYVHHKLYFKNNKIYKIELDMGGD